jgi:predicted DNA-binding protein
MPTSVRLDAETEELIRRLAKKRGMTKSEVVREALEEWVDRENEKPEKPYDAIEHLIGIADSGGQGLSERTGERFRRLLEEKRRGKKRTG